MSNATGLSVFMAAFKSSSGMWSSEAVTPALFGSTGDDKSPSTVTVVPDTDWWSSVLKTCENLITLVRCRESDWL